MLLLKVTNEYRTDSEAEAKELMEKVRAEAKEKGYVVGASGYTYKEKKKSGEIIDSAYIVKNTLIYNEVWNI